MACVATHDRWKTQPKEADQKNQITFHRNNGIAFHLKSKNDMADWLPLVVVIDLPHLLAKLAE